MLLTNPVVVAPGKCWALATDPTDPLPDPPDPGLGGHPAAPLASWASLGKPGQAWAILGNLNLEQDSCLLVIRGTGRRRARLLFRTILRKTLKTNLQVELLRKGWTQQTPGWRKRKGI